jgi:hypothetical protein
VSLKVYDFPGQEVATIVNDKLSPGTYKNEFYARDARQGSDLPSGIYFYSLLINGDTEDRKLMILLK